MITKTHYVTFRSCPRRYYYLLHDPKKAKTIDIVAQKRIDEGKLVGDYAHLYFEGTAKVKNDPNIVNIENQIAVTKKLLPNTKYIAEASFKFEDLFCAVDILAKNGDCYDIYEVKASTNLSKHIPEYIADVAFQKYVLELCGLEIKNCFILHLNPDYIRHGDIDPKQMLKPYQLNGLHPEAKDPQKISSLFNEENKVVSINIAKMRQLSKLPAYGDCDKNCDFFEFCHKDLPKPNVLNLCGLWSSKAHALIENGIVTFQNVLDNEQRLSEFKVKLNPYHQLQLKAHLSQDTTPYIDKEQMAIFFSQLKDPIYHLDFETMNEAVPPFDGVGCYNQIPFQYSLHIQNKAGGKLIHKEFLATKLDDEYALAKQLCQDIPLDVTSMSYNMNFERSVLKHLAERFPDLSTHLMNIHNNMVDLLIPFKKGFYYNTKQNGSNSIKYVMPVVCPKHANDYVNLPLVHNGGQALSMFPEMIKMSGKKLEETRNGMLKYCELDTHSMVWVLDALWKLCKK